MLVDRPRSILMGLTGLSVGGGIASVSRMMARALDAEVASGRLDRVDRVLMIDEPPGPPPPPAPSVQRLSHGSQLRFAAQLWGRVIATRPDLILFDHLGLARSLLPRLPLPRPPHAIFIHGGELRGTLSPDRVHVLETASVILSNSDFSANVLRVAVPGVDHPVKTIPLCIEPDRKRAWEELASARAAAPEPRRPAALIVGRMVAEEPGKGHEALIDAWPAVRREVPAAELWIVGDGDDTERLRRRSADAGASDAVRFLGRVSDEKLAELYRTASVYAMPSRQEGFGLVYVEAMLHGVPCIASTADAASCVVDESCGILVPYGDVDATARAVSKILCDPDLSRTMGEAGRRRVEERFIFDRFREHFVDALGLG